MGCKSVPRVTVIVANYNSSEMGAEAVRSALAQTFGDLEVIVVDDGSEDGSDSRIEAIRAEQVRVIRQANAGPAAASNRGLREARGEYVALLDHDDLWAAEKLARQVGVMEGDAGLDLTFSWSRMIDEEGRPLGLQSNRWRGGLSFAEMLADFVIGNTSSVVMRRTAVEAVGGFDEGLRLFYDMDLFLRMAALREGNCRAVEEDLTFYRRHARQVSADWRGMAREWPQLIGKFAGTAPEEVLRTSDANMMRYFSFLAYARREHGAALGWWGRCVGRRPGALWTDGRNVKMGAACVAGLVLPRRVHGWLEQMAGVRIGER